MNTKYEDVSQFQELNANYYVHPSPRYVFFMVNAGTVSKFSVYLTDNVIIDEYEEENKINQELVSLFLEEDLYKNTRSLKKILNQLSVNDDKTMIIYRGG